MRMFFRQLLSTTSLALLVMCSGPAAAAAPPAAIPLYDGPAPGAVKDEPAEIDEHVAGHHVVRNVSAPSLTAYLPDPAKATGSAVIIAPGGAFMMLSIDSEGDEMARWLAARGVAAFLLKYRLVQTPQSDLLFTLELAKLLHGLGPQGGNPGLAPLPGEDAAVADGLQAVRLVRSRASEWGLNPGRIGFLGFSAGGIVAVRVASEYDAASRPAFVASAYGVKAITHGLPQDLPPLFFTVAEDDPLFGRDASYLYDTWKKAGAEVEMHVFHKGGHGFGTHQQHLSSDHWIDEFGWWLADLGMLSASH